MDAAEFTSKERKQARKNLLRKIDTYNKQIKKTPRQPSASFPITTPSKDLLYKGIVKVTYDRGYALQTKSLLLENTTTAHETIEQLFEALGLNGKPKDYALEERNALTGENRIVDGAEMPLNLQLNHSGHQNYMELRIIQVRDSLSALSTVMSKGRGSSSRMTPADDSDSDGTLSEGSTSNLVPKEEVIDHGMAKIEVMMEEALQDIPPLVHDIQERLKGISESVAVDGKPRSGLPNKRHLWDRLKPQASSLVKDIRRLVDNGEFLANRHCKNSPVVKLIITLLLELITDHSRELVTAIKEMCGLRGATKTDFDISVSRFTQQVTYISKLVGKTNDALYSMAITGHLQVATSPENFQKDGLSAESYFTGSKSVSGVLLFTVVSAYLGLVRAAYEEKCEYYGSLATNMLRSAQRALETIKKTDEYGMLHLHPLKSRVMDMEHKLRVAMDNLIAKVKVAASSRPPPDATPEMLQCGYSIITSTLDFLMVAQCASLVHKVAINGWELMQFPWVRAIANTSGNDLEPTAIRSALADQLSSLGSDSTSSHSTGGESSVYKGTPEKSTYYAGERRSRIHSLSNQRERGDGMEATDMATKDHKFIRTSRVMSQYEHYTESGEDQEEDNNEILRRPSMGDTSKFSSYGGSDRESIRSMAVSASSTSDSGKASTSPSKLDPHYTGIDAVKKLRESYNINKIIARGAEALLFTLTQKINSLSALCRSESRDKYMGTVQLILSASRQIREEVASMEVDIVISENMVELLDKSKPQMESAVKELQLSVILTSGPAGSENSSSRLLSAALHLKDISSKTVAEALCKVTEHKKALEEAENIEQEFMTLVTGQRESSDMQTLSNAPPKTRKPSSSTIRSIMAEELNTEGIVFEANPHGGGRGLMAKETPRVIAGTVPKLVQRLTLHRVIDLEFNETFLLTFHSFMSPDDMLNFLQKRFNMQPTDELMEEEKEAYLTDILIPIQLRVVYCLKKWLQLSYDDFRNKELCKKLNSFLATIQRSMPSCGMQLEALKQENLTYGPLHLQRKPQRKPPTPLVPINLSRGKYFDLLDVNTLELARQLTVAFSDLLRGITPQEILSLGWKEDSGQNNDAPHIVQFLQMSQNFSELVCKEVMRETIDEDQTSVLSYFIQAAKSCLDLKNYEAVFAIVGGLESREVQRAVTSWQLMTDHLKGIYAELREVVSPELNYSHYKHEICTVYQTPCIPRLSIILSELEAIDKEYPSISLSDNNDELVNFQRRRMFAKVIQHIQGYQTISYNFHVIEVMQLYIEKLKNSLSNEELDKLSTKIESFLK